MFPPAPSLTLDPVPAPLPSKSTSLAPTPAPHPAPAPGSSSQLHVAAKNDTHGGYRVAGAWWVQGGRSMVGTGWKGWAQLGSSLLLLLLLLEVE